jgi:hypothetical protein
MPDERLIRRRLPAFEKKIADIQPETDVRVRLVGTVIDSSMNSVVLDDGSGKVEIYFEDQPNVKNGQLVRIITRVLPLIDGFECRGEVLQSLDGFNLDLYKRVKEIVR